MEPYDPSDPYGIAEFRDKYIEEARQRVADTEAWVRSLNIHRHYLRTYLTLSWVKPLFQRWHQCWQRKGGDF